MIVIIIFITVEKPKADALEVVFLVVYVVSNNVLNILQSTGYLFNGFFICFLVSGTVLSRAILELVSTNGVVLTFQDSYYFPKHFK